MKGKTARQIKDLVTVFYDRFAELSEETTSIKLSKDKWSLKEIIGHLVDSASNNHQRFVRLQIEKELHFPAYHYSWIDIEKYNTVPFRDVLLLWKQFNLLLAHIIEQTDNSNANNTWHIDDGSTITLHNLITDYLQHLNEHVKHFEDRYNEIKND